MPDIAKPEERRVDTTLSKGLAILEALSRAEGGRGVTEIARDLDLSKSNAFRLLQTLSTLGYVRQTGERRYAPTMKAWQIGQAIADKLDLATLFAEELMALSRATGETVYLSVPDGLSILYVDKIESIQPLRSFTPKGGSAPMHCVGTGKALLAHRYERLRGQVAHHLVRFTDRTITDLAALDRDVEETLRHGYAVDRGEYRERIFSFGAVAALPNGEAVAALGISVPDVNLGDREKDFGRLVLDAARAASLRLAS